MKRNASKLAAIILASVLMIALIPAAASAAIAGPSAPTFSTVMRHTPRTLFPVPGSAVLTVTDAETGLPVAGAKYDLYRIAEFACKDTKVATLTTNKDGKITVSHATTGKFYWTAAAEVEGYAADEAKHEFTIIGVMQTVTEVALTKPVVEEEPEVDYASDLLLGGWNLDVDPEITDALKAVFEKGTEGLLGVDYEPYTYFASQLVAGTNHCFLCMATPVVPDAESYFAFVFLYEDLEGNVKVLDIVTMDEFMESAFGTIDGLLDGIPAILGETEETETAETTEAPAETAEAPAETAEAPAETTEAPAETAEAPAETAEAPAEAAEPAADAE